MTCRQAEPLLARAADGTLDAERGAALAPHLDACADCRDALAAQRATRALLAARPPAPAPFGFAARVMANLPERETAPAAGWLAALRWRTWTLRLAPVAGALFVGAALGPGPAAGTAAADAPEYSDVVTAWMAEETADGAVRDPAAAETVSRLWQDAGETADDLFLDVLLADPRVSLPGADEAGR